MKYMAYSREKMDIRTDGDKESEVQDMRRRIYGFLAVGVMSCLLFAGCAPKIAYIPFDLNPQIKSGQFVQKTDNFIVLYDTSASMAEKFGADNRMASGCVLMAMETSV